MATKAKCTTRPLLKEVKYLISRVREVDAVALEEFVLKLVDAECHVLFLKREKVVGISGKLMAG